MMHRAGFTGAAILAFATAAAAQQTTGNLEGRVVDESGQVIAAAVITVSSPSLQGQRKVTSSQEGRFRLLELPVGMYVVVVAHPNFQQLALQEVAIQLGRTTALGDVKLGLRRYEESVVVRGERPLLDPTTTATGGNLGTEEYAALPIGRDYRSVAILLPQANESFLGDAVNFAGSTGLENRYFIDGIDVTDPNRGITGTSLPYNFVQEVQVRTGAYEAEYRSSLGGVINAVTYSGGNELRGQVFGFFSNNRSAAESRLGVVAPDKGSFAYYDVGFGLGGPILTDRLWYYVAYNPTFRREEVRILGQDMFEDRTTTHSFAGKLTWQASPKSTLVLTAIGDPTERDGVGASFLSYGVPVSFGNPDPYLERIRTGSASFLLEGRQTVRDNLLLRTFLSRATRKDRNVPATERGRTDVLFIDTGTGAWSGGAPDNVDNSSTVTTAGLDCTWIAGNHLLKAGLEYRDNRWDFEMTGHSLTRYSDVQYFEFVSAAKGRVGVRVPSAFLQDSWLLTERLRVSAGVRWDGQYIIASNGKVAQTILDQWQPRVGFTWQQSGAGIDQVSGSFGRFYQELPTWPLFFYYNAGSRWAFIYYDHDPRVNPAGGRTISIPGVIQPEISDMEGQYFDEFTLGYERRVGRSAKVGLRGIYRTLRQALEDGLDPVTGEFQFNNPGRGVMKDYPRAKRNYSALEVSYQQTAGERLTFLASYVLSRTYGNYTGLFNSDFNFPFPNANGSFDVLETLTNGEGLLPNDRTHVLKLSASYWLKPSLAVGFFGLWETGTPLSELGGARIGAPYYDFLRQRGTAGRMPDIWDLNLRVAYAPPTAAASHVRPRVTLDLLHVGSQRTAVNYDQIHYFNVDEAGDQINPNPTYGKPTRYQPPMAVRVGVELSY